MALINLTSDLRKQSEDYVKRNSPQSTGINPSSPIGARIRDVERIAKFLASSKGLAFAGKQAALLTIQNILKDDKVNLTDVSLEVASFIATILAQTPAAGTGVFFSTFELQQLVSPESPYYLDKEANKEALFNGKVVISRTNKMRGRMALDAEDGYGFADSLKSDKVGQLGVLTKEQFTALDQYNIDFIPVIFSVPDEDKSVLVFRGFINNVSDNYTTNTNTTFFVGRGEPVYTYANTVRNISFSLQIPIFTQKEQNPVYEKLNSLLSYAYPRYNGELPQGTLIKFNIGTFLNAYGILNNINYTVDNNVTWSGEDENGSFILPQLITVNIALSVIHDRLPKRYTGDQGRPFVAPQLPREDLDVTRLPSKTIPKVPQREERIVKLNNKPLPRIL